MRAAPTGNDFCARYVNLAFTAFVLAVFAVAFALTFGLNPIARQIPRLISGLGIVLALLEIVVQVKALPAGAAESDEGPSPRGGVSWYFGLALATGYICCMFLIGFLVSTSVFLFFVPVVLGYRRLTITLAFSIISTALLYCSFTYVFLLDLPAGILLRNWLGR